MRSAAGNPCKPGDLPVAPLALLVAKRANDPVIRRDDPDRFRLNCGKCTGNILLSQKVDPRLIGGDVRANLLNLIERSIRQFKHKLGVDIEPLYTYCIDAYCSSLARFHRHSNNL